MRDTPSLGEIRFGTLARAAEGLTQWRPLLMLFLTLLVTGALLTLGQLLAVNVAGILMLVFMVLAFVVLMAGSSAVGIMLMDKAKNEAVRSFAAAASAGLLCLPKFLMIGVVMFVATLAYGIVAAIIYFVCKIPFIGAIVAFVAHPILVLVAAAILIVLIWVVGPLLAPALWSGMSVKAALANVLLIARKRLVEVVLMELVLYIILSLICVMIFAGLAPATVSLTAMAIGITGDTNAMMGMAMGAYGRGMGMSPMAGMMGNGAGMGLVSGLGVMYCVVGALVAQVAIMGMNLIYLQARESVNPEEAQAGLDDLMGDMRKKATEAKEQAKAAAEQAKQAMAQKMQERAAAQATAQAANTDGASSTDATVSNTSSAAAPAGYAPASSSASASTAAAATAGMAGYAAGALATDHAASQSPSPSADEMARAEQQARERAAAEEAAAARQRTEAEVARVRAEAEAEAARLKAENEAAALAKQQAEEHAQRERAAAQAAEDARRIAQAQAAEQARLHEQAEAAERAAQERATQERAAAEQARHKAEAEANAEAARLRAEEDARRQAQLQAQHDAAEREAARIRAQAEADAQAAQQPAATPVAPTCPACQSPVSADDMFCGECGHKMK